MFHWLSTMSDAVETVVEAVVETGAPAAANALVELPLITKGLLTTAVGLLGVFLVLTLFFATIRVMRLIKAKDSEN